MLNPKEIHQGNFLQYSNSGIIEVIGTLENYICHSKNTYGADEPIWNNIDKYSGIPFTEEFKNKAWKDTFEIEIKYKKFGIPNTSGYYETWCFIIGTDEGYYTREFEFVHEYQNICAAFMPDKMQLGK